MQCDLLCSLAPKVSYPGVIYIAVAYISLTEASHMSVSHFRGGGKCSPIINPENGMPEILDVQCG